MTAAHGTLISLVRAAKQMLPSLFHIHSTLKLMIFTFSVGTFEPHIVNHLAHEFLSTCHVFIASAEWAALIFSALFTQRTLAQFTDDWVFGDTVASTAAALLEEIVE